MPFAVGLVLVVLAFADPCNNPRENVCVDGTGAFVGLFYFAPLAAAQIGFGVLARRAQSWLRRTRQVSAEA